MKKLSKRKIISAVTAATIFALSLILYFVRAFFPLRASIYVGREKKLPGEMRLHFVDVGQGDCAVVELPDGKLMIVDGGNDLTDHARTVYRYVQALGYDRVDHLVVTHPDEDHYAGLIYLAQKMKIDKAYLPFATGTESAKYTSFIVSLQKKCEVVESRTYLLIEGEDYFCMFLSPHGQDTFEDGYANKNDLSSVMWLDYRGVDTLFCGDITTTVENRLRREWTVGKKIGENTFAVNGREVDLESTEILKVAHHGSAYSTSARWLELLNVQTAIVSSGTENSFGHPTAETLQRLQNAKAEIYRTDECGSIIITISDRGAYRVEFENEK